MSDPIKNLRKNGKVDWVNNVRQELRHCADCAEGACEYKASFVSRDLPVPLHGEVKQLFAENMLGTALLELFRKITPNSIEGGEVKTGIMNHLAAYGLRIPYLTGVWSNSRLVENGITTTGKAALASRMNGSGGEAAFTAVGYGTGTTAFNVADTAMETGVLADGTGDSGVHALNTAAITVSRTTTTVTNDTARLTGTSAITATIAITESGVFNADTNGTMACRQTFSAVNVINGDSFVPTWDISNA